jgi:uncharacterized protein YbjT (DUF2867 family)
VRTLTRDAGSSEALALAQAGVEVIEGDLSDATSVAYAITGVHGVFSVQPSPISPRHPRDFGHDDEIQQGRNVADAAKAAAVRHFVYASVSGADQPEVTIFAAKRAIEAHSRELGLPATILRPVSFMENFASDFMIRDGAVSTPIAPDVAEKLIAVEDIGAVAALVFADPERYVGQEVGIAGDALTPVQVSEAITQALGRPVPYRQVPMSVLREAAGEVVADGFQWLNTAGYPADVDSTRALRPATLRFTDWLERTGKAKLEALLAAST